MRVREGKRKNRPDAVGAALNGSATLKTVLLHIIHAKRHFVRACLSGRAAIILTQFGVVNALMKLSMNGHTLYLLTRTYISNRLSRCTSFSRRGVRWNASYLNVQYRIRS